MRLERSNADSSSSQLSSRAAASSEEALGSCTRVAASSTSHRLPELSLSSEQSLDGLMAAVRAAQPHKVGVAESSLVFH